MITYAQSLAYEYTCERDAQPTYDDDAIHGQAVDELVDERLSGVPEWVVAEFLAGRQNYIDPTHPGFPEWLANGLMLATVPDLRTLARESLDDGAIEERAGELGFCAEEQ